MIEQLQTLNWADWVIIGVLLISSLLSLMRGFVREALSLLTWIAAFFIARIFGDNMEGLLADSITTPSLRAAVAFIILFVATLIVGGLLSRLMVELIKMSGLSATDRILGMVFGLARGLVIMIVAVALLRLTPLSNDLWWEESVMVEKLQMIENWSRKVFRTEISPVVSAN